MKPFVHLHLHTQYSVLDGANKIKPLIAQAKKVGQPAIAMTDHGNMHGAIEFYTAAKAAEVKPVIGCEVYVAAGAEAGQRKVRKSASQGGPRTCHLTLLAMGSTGYQNLCKLVSLGYQEGFYFKPRIDRELLKELNAGIICLSGCLSGEFSGFAGQHDETGAKEFISEYARIFKDRFYLEVQPHQIAEQQHLNKFARHIGDTLGIPLVATNDCHYLSADDHYAQEVLMCVATGKLITDPDRLKHEGAHLHFKTTEEMHSEMPEFSDAIERASEIADLCNLELEFSTYHMPRFNPPEGRTIEDYFKEEVNRGLERRFTEISASKSVKGNGKKGLTEELKQVYWSRLEEEISLIHRMGFGGYFLVVSDFVRWAKANDVPVGPGRGSAAGSLVAYVLAITEIDPIEHKLLFERFLNPERVSMPDIDVDFCINGRDKVIEYVCQRYGRDKVAQIVTFGTLKAKAAIKDVGRVLGLSYAETDKVAKLIPAPRQGFDYPIADAIKMEPKLKQYAEGEGKKLIELAQKLEGLSRHVSTHAAGLVIADRPIVEYMPLLVDKDNQVVSQFSMGWVEKLGLVKFDFLGLKTLSVLREAVRLIYEKTGKELTLNSLPLNDPATFRLISAGKTTGVFQLESSGITEMVTRLKPNTFEDIVAILALYRPGPLDAGMVDHYINRKHGKEVVKYLHPLLEPILKDTYGIILYQEQIMRIARDLGGYSLAQADMLRRAMGKKKPEEMAKQRNNFLNGARERKISDKVATEVFDQMETFARYGFNRSHSVAYAFVSYQTAYLKAHFPMYFMAALMTFEMNDTDKTLKNLSECRSANIKVMAPDVNEGDRGFNVSNGKILFALAAIKGVGAKAVDRIIEDRKENGVFASLLDFCIRVDSSLVNRRALEGFVRAGAFDWTGLSRAEMIERVEPVIKMAARIRQDRESPQLGLFGQEESQAAEVYTPIRELLAEWPVNIKLAHEKEALGFYLSGHPLEKFRSELSRLGAISIDKLRDYTDGSKVLVAGIINLLKLKNTKKGDRYASFVLEDLAGTVEVLVWPDVYKKVSEILGSEDPVLINAKLMVSDERRTLVANEVESAIVLRDRNASQAIIQLNYHKCDTEKIVALKKLVDNYPGKCPLTVVLKRSLHSEAIVKLPEDVSVEPSESLCNEMERLFGEPVLSFR